MTEKIKNRQELIDELADAKLEVDIVYFYAVKHISLSDDDKKAIDEILEGVKNRIRRINDYLESNSENSQVLPS